jgi:4-methylaminobutanoate oxidase (formaldehyde-forming)
MAGSEAETGQADGMKPVGSLRSPPPRRRWSELKRMATTARSFDFELHTLSPKEAGRQVPADLARRHRRRGVRAQRRIGRAVQPHHGLRPGARTGGVRIVERVLVTGFESDRRRVTRVLTDHGAIDCEIVVNAAGIWARDVARMAGVQVPAGAVEHQYIITEKSSAVPAGLPTLRDPDRIFYLKPEPGALAIGGWEKGTPTFGARGVPFDFGRELSQPTRTGSSSSCCRPPSACRSERARHPHGDQRPDPDLARRRADHGAGAGARQFLRRLRLHLGHRRLGGAGKAMAEWIVEGEPGLDLWAFDVRRFGSHHMSARYLAERSVDSYWRYYQIHYPIEELSSARGGRRSPLYPLLEAQNAVFGSRFGWERPNWFAPAGTEPIDKPSFESRPNWFGPVGNECRAARERAVLVDQSSFSKYEITGPAPSPPCSGSPPTTSTSRRAPRLHAALQRARRHRDRPHLRPARREPLLHGDRQRFRRARHGLDQEHLPTDGSVSVQELTSAARHDQPCGPLSRQILEQVADGDVSNQAFPYMTARELRIGFAPVLALRVTYVGELGWELHLPDRIRRPRLRASLGGRPGNWPGRRRLPRHRFAAAEKRYLYWGSDITPDYTPYEAGLGFAVSLKKKSDFIGRAALEKARAAGPKRR